MRQRIRRRLACSRGYTLAEVVIVMALSTVVFGVPLTFIVLSLTQQNVSSSRSVAATQEEVGLERLDRDIRQALASPSSTFTWGSTSASVSMYVPVAGTGGGSSQQITWSCTFPAGSCTRTAGSGSAVTEITNVQSVTFAPVDTSGNALGGGGPTYTASNPAYVGITLKVADISQLDRTGTHTVAGVTNPVTLQDGIDLRNNSL
jgi:hypothetical protein